MARIGSLEEKTVVNLTSTMYYNICKKKVAKKARRNSIYYYSDMFANVDQKN